MDSPEYLRPMPDLARIRPADPDDAPQMAALLNEIIAIGGSTALETPVTAGDMRAWYIDGPLVDCCHVAVDDAGDITGFQVLEHDEVPQGIAYISTFARQSPRVPGVGTALFQATCTAARGLGLREISAKIRGDNVSGLGYYSKMGFRDHSVDPGVPLKDGTPVDRIVKRFQL